MHQKTMDADPRRPVLCHLEVDLDIFIVAHEIDSADVFSAPKLGRNRPLLTLVDCRIGKETDGRSFWSRLSALGVKLGARLSRTVVELCLNVAKMSVEDVLVEPSPKSRSILIADAAGI